CHNVKEKLVMTPRSKFLAACFRRGARDFVQTRPSTGKATDRNTFFGYNPEPVRGWKIARQTERRRMYPWCAAPNRAFDRSCRTAPTSRSVTCPVADRGGTSW